MTTAPADAREVILAAIRGRFLDDDVELIRLDEDDDDRHMRSIAEHALDAALARGAPLAAVHAAAAIELARVRGDGLARLEPDPSDHGLFDEELDHLAEVPLERLGIEPPGEELEHAVTLNDLRRSRTMSLLYLLATAIGLRALRRVGEVFVARRRERGLDDDTMLGEVIGREERLALFTAGLYNDEVSPAP